MNKKTTAAIVLCSAMAASASQEEWGGHLFELEYNQKRQLVRVQFQWVGGIDSYSAMEVIESRSPWEGVGDPDPDWIVARGTTWCWFGDERWGYNWTQKAGQEPVKEDLKPEWLALGPPSAPNFWGLYKSRGGKYRRAGGFHCGVRNASARIQGYEVNVEWQANKWSPEHWITNRFYVSPGRIARAMPQPGIGSYAWASDSSISMWEVGQ